MDERIVVGRGDPGIAELLDEVIGEDYPGLVEKATPEKIAALRERHCKLYRFRLDSQIVAVNVEETERLLQIWQGVVGREFSELSDEAKLEVLVALAAEEP